MRGNTRFCPSEWSTLIDPRAYFACCFQHSSKYFVTRCFAPRYKNFRTRAENMQNMCPRVDIYNNNNIIISRCCFSCVLVDFFEKSEHDNNNIIIFCFMKIYMTPTELNLNYFVRVFSFFPTKNAV